MSTRKLITTIFYVIIAIVFAISFYYIFIASTTIGQKPEVMVKDPNILKGAGIAMMLSYILLAICALAMVIFPLIYIIQHPKSAGKTFMGIGVLAVVFLIGYFTATNEVNPNYIKFGIDTPGKSKLVGGLLNSTYILMVLAVIAYIYNGVMGVIKQQ